MDHILFLILGCMLGCIAMCQVAAASRADEELKRIRKQGKKNEN